MKPKRTVQPLLEVLEDRYVPATVSVTGGNLAITGTTSTMSVQALSNTSYKVTDNSVATTVNGVTGNITLNLASATTGESIDVNLNGFKTGHDLVIKTGAGADTVTVENGTVGHDLVINTKGGADSVTLGDGTTTLTIKNITSVTGGPRANNAVIIQAKTTIQSTLVATAEKKVVLAQGARVQAGATIAGSSAGYDITIAGSIANTLYFVGAAKVDATASFTLTATGSIGQSLIAYTGTNFLDYTASSDTFNLDGHIGQNLYLQLGGGIETVTFGPDFSLGGQGLVFFGGVINTFTYNTPPTQPIDAAIVGNLGGSNTFNGDTNRPATVRRFFFQTINP
jgi:hypothetical protein